MWVTAMLTFCHCVLLYGRYGVIKVAHWFLIFAFRDSISEVDCNIRVYKFKRGFATPIIFIFDLRRNVPYFYDTFRVEKITLVAELNVIPDAPWW